MSRLVQLGGMTRRGALQALAGGIAALEAGCLAEPGADVMPYVNEPPELRPGVPVKYASALALDGYAHGVIVETRDGRPLKIDGNPAHPSTLGGSSPALQARILDLYDPQRAREMSLGGEPASWARLEAMLGALRGRVWLVMPPSSSRTVAALLARAQERMTLSLVCDAPLARFADEELQVDVARADVIAALDADWLAGMPMALAWSRAVGERRTGHGRPLRLWTCEPAPTASGSIADERLALPGRDAIAIAAAVAVRTGAIAPPAAVTRALAHRLGADRAAWAHRLGDELARGCGAVIAGARQPAIVHAIARAIHAHAGARGAATYTPTPLLPGAHTLADLAQALRARQVDAVVVLDANPVYHAPRELELDDLLADAPLSLHAGLYLDETARACQARIPLAHELESWGDACGYEGTRALVQPVIRPRFPVASLVELLAPLAADRRSPRAIVQDACGLGDAAWRAALASGVVEGSAPAARPPTAPDHAALLAELAKALAPHASESIEIALAPSRLHDGRFAGNAWLQELPHPITKQTWGNAALLGPDTAAGLGVEDGRVVRIETAGGSIELPALVVPGCAPGSITIELGYGRVAPALPIAHRLGANGFALRHGDSLLQIGTALARTGSRALARTVLGFSEEGRELAPQLTRGELRPTTLDHLRGDQPSLLPEPSHVGWGMTIDTSICTGCSACMVACQAENNIAIVGAEQVARGRHMNWIRIDRYVDDSGDAVNQPLPCQHCEQAPCEYVCPTEATTHSADGLNEMTYNRCIGTRFCSNNCPYKVRRFNWFAFEREDSTQLQYNPDVTVRSRGVMEKCTYCVQRIRRAEIHSRVEARAIRPGEVVTACQQACPTGAIQFGRVEETGTPFARSRRDIRRYDLLHDLGTRPRTIYLAKVRER